MVLGRKSLFLDVCRGDVNLYFRPTRAYVSFEMITGSAHIPCIRAYPAPKGETSLHSQSQPPQGVH
jgi:hypothetical protein